MTKQSILISFSPISLKFFSNAFSRSIMSKQSFLISFSPIFHNFLQFFEFHKILSILQSHKNFSISQFFPHKKKFQVNQKIFWTKKKHKRMSRESNKILFPFDLKFFSLLFFFLFAQRFQLKKKTSEGLKFSNQNLFRI